MTLAAVFALGLLLMFWPKYHQYMEYQRRERDLAEEIRIEEETIKRLKRYQERFPADSQFVERIAHDAGMVRSNEVIYTFVPDPQPDAPAGATP